MPEALLKSWSNIYRPNDNVSTSSNNIHQIMLFVNLGIIWQKSCRPYNCSNIVVSSLNVCYWRFINVHCSWLLHDLFCLIKTQYITCSFPECVFVNGILGNGMNNDIFITWLENSFPSIANKNVKWFYS